MDIEAYDLPVLSFNNKRFGNQLLRTNNSYLAMDYNIGLLQNSDNHFNVLFTRQQALYRFVNQRNHIFGKLKFINLSLYQKKKGEIYMNCQRTRGN